MPRDPHHLHPAHGAEVEAAKAPRREELRLLVEHAASRCADCAEALADYRNRLDGRAGAGHLARGKNHAGAAAGLTTLARAFAADRRATTRELWFLGREQGDGVLRLVEIARSRFRSPLLVERMIGRARELLRHEPRQAAVWLEAAEAVALRAATEAGETLAPVRELRWRARAQRGNALRVAGDLPAADELLSKLRSEITQDREVPSLALRAELASLEASLRQDQRRFGEAKILLEKARRRYSAAGDRLGKLKASLKLSISLRLSGDGGAALRCLEAACDRDLDTADERLLVAYAGQRALCLCDLEEFAAARELLTTDPRLGSAAASDPWTALRLAWLQGRVAVGLGEIDEACRLLQRTRDGYLDLGLGYDAAMVAVDLAELHLRRGDTAEVKTLAEEMFAVFEARDVHAEAARALRLFQRAATAERLTVELVAALRRYLATSRNDPRHRFRAGGR